MKYGMPTDDGKIGSVFGRRSLRHDDADRPDIVPNDSIGASTARARAAAFLMEHGVGVVPRRSGFGCFRLSGVRRMDRKSP